MTNPLRIATPLVNDHPIWDLIFSFWAAPAFLVAHDLKLFSRLGEKPRTLSEVCGALNIEPHAAEVLLQMNVAFGFIEASDGAYRLTEIASEYLVESSPVALCGYLDFLAGNHKLWSVESLKKAVLTNSPQVGGKDMFSAPEAQKAFAKVFTRAMYAHSIGAAIGWPGSVDLSRHRALLDIGGGSGAHTACALERWPNLEGMVLDTPAVIAEAAQYVAPFRLGDRIKLHAADMWSDPFPPSDIHLYGDIFHDWPKEKGKFLAEKSFESLPSGGKIILREVLFNNTRTGPFSAAAYDVDMLLLTLGGQYSTGEISQLLAETGFRDVVIGPPGAGYRSLIQAVKP